MADILADVIQAYGRADRTVRLIEEKALGVTDWAEHLGGQLELLHYEDGSWRFGHTCDRSAANRGIIRCAPLLQDAHRLREERGLVTVEGSILCSDCGIHGFVTQNLWRYA